MNAAAPPPSEVGSLRVRFGRDAFPLAQPRILVGRSRSCEIRVKEDTVSRLHAAFVWTDTGLFIEDLGSSNGTFVNGKRLANPLALSPGDVVRFGGLRGTVEPIDAPPLTASYDEPQEGPDYTAGLVHGEPAGIGWRLLAGLTDLALFSAGSLIPFAPLLATAFAERYLLSPDVIPPGLETKAVIAGGCGALWIFYAVYYVIHGWAKRGGTPGLRLCGLRLIDWQQRIPIGYARAWLRLGASLVTVMTLGLGFLLPVFRRDRKTLHDLLAGTLVVHRARALGAGDGAK